MIDWKRKLSSRKFWAAVVGFVAAILVAFGVDDLTIEQVTALITGVAVLIAYIFGEGMVDKERAETQSELDSD
ncbi:MAG TPA: hypothetical protein VLH56_11150 [Dissulfurispiraceae bacterium]|nr:hypothetical protein [Dissulfurispiraceae bacterium]